MKWGAAGSAFQIMRVQAVQADSAFGYATTLDTLAHMEFLKVP
jgi:hypothetical protein